MDISDWLIYLIVALSSALSPGPATLLAISNSINLGVRQVVFSSLGNITGLFILATLATIGVGALLKTVPALFFTIKLAGAAYLIFCGIQQWRTSTTLFSPSNATYLTPPKNHQQLFIQGLSLALTNPKAILFCAAIFPQFLTLEHTLTVQFSILIGTFMMCSFCSLMSYAFLAYSISKWLAMNRHALWLNRFFGTVFILLGIGLFQLEIE